jgi:molecular chaperone GrpE
LGKQKKRQVPRICGKVWKLSLNIIRRLFNWGLSDHYRIEIAVYRLETEKNELVEKLSTLTEEITSGKDRFIRLQADFDNFRRRSGKERLSVRSDAQGEVIESLLPMVDNFERAKQQLQPETDKEKQIDTIFLR